MAQLNETGAPAKTPSILPPMTDSRHLADEMMAVVDKTMKGDNISLDEVYEILTQISPDDLDKYDHPLLTGIRELCESHPDQGQIFYEAFCILQLELKRRKDFAEAIARQDLKDKFTKLFHTRE